MNNKIKMFAVIGLSLSALFLQACGSKTETNTEVTTAPNAAEVVSTKVKAETAKVDVADEAADNSSDTEIEGVFNKSCVSCHLSGVAGAPRKGDSAEWQRRIDAKGMPTLVESVRKGLNAMPPMGMCTDCDDETFAALITWMAKAQ